MSVSRPFKDFKVLEDVCKCSNAKCKYRFNCIRYMAKNSEWQSITKFDNKESCDHYIPYYVWKDSEGRKYLLEDIENNHLMAIIIHLYERYIISNNMVELNLAKEFTKEAKRRRIIK